MDTTDKQTDDNFIKDYLAYAYSRKHTGDMITLTLEKILKERIAPLQAENDRLRLALQTTSKMLEDRIGYDGDDKYRDQIDKNESLLSSPVSGGTNDKEI